MRRLYDTQKKIDDIMSGKTAEDRRQIMHLIESAMSYIEETAEDVSPESGRILEQIHKRLSGVYAFDEICLTKIELETFLNSVCENALSSMNKRDVEIIRDFEKGLFLQTDQTVLEKVCSGLLKNAVENTPELGKIEISALKEKNKISIVFRDTGTGITEQNLKHIFMGFFHTQDTGMYSSKRPYEFNAGGSGSDLLRIKVFSEKYGFSVKAESIRCRYIPNDSDLCPGRISECPFISDPEFCRLSGSVFSITW